MDDPALSLPERLAVAIGRLRRRSDVVLTRFHRAGPQPFGGFAKELPDDLVAAHRHLGALSIGFRFVDEENPRGSWNLRAPTSKGWTDHESPRLTRWDKWRPADREGFVDEEGRPWSEGTRYAIVLGAEEAGVALRAHPDGSFRYASFDSDRQTRELGDAFEPLIDEAIERRFTGSPGRPDGEAIARLAAEAPARATLDAEVLEVESLSPDGLRAFVLGRSSDLALRSFAKLMNQKDLPKRDPDERGRAIADATAEEMDAAAMKEWLAPFRGGKTQTAYRERFLLGPLEPHVRLDLELTPRRDEHGMGLTKNDLSATGGFAAKVLLELLGPVVAESLGVAADRIRYATGTDAPWGEAVRGVSGKRSGQRMRLELAVPAAWVADLGRGARSLSVIDPFGPT